VAGRGQPLDHETRSYFERALGTGLGSVRVHAGPRDAQAARDAGARAYAVGEHVVFGAGEYAPQTARGRRLLAHELVHVLQARRHRMADVVSRQAVPAADVSMTPDFAARLEPAELVRLTQALQTRAAAPATAGDEPEVQRNLAVLEAEAVNRMLARTHWQPPAQAEPFLSASVGRDGVLADYRARARALLVWRLEAVAQWIDIVVRAKIAGQSPGGREKAAADLRAAAKTANALAYQVWRAKIVVDDYARMAELIPDGELERPATTPASRAWIRERFTRAALTRLGFVPEIPDIVEILLGLGEHRVTEAEVSAKVPDLIPERQLYERGQEQFIRQGRLRISGRGGEPAGWPNRWVGPPPTDAEIVAVGRLTVDVRDPELRQQAREQLRAGRPRDEEEQAVLSLGSSTEPALNYVALRFVYERLRRQADDRLERQRAALDAVFAQHPLLREYVSNWAFLRNELPVGAQWQDVIPVDDIRADTLGTKLDELLKSVRGVKHDVATDDDYLFDVAVRRTLEPLIDQYRRIRAEYGDWIGEAFEINQRWREAIDTLISTVGMLAGAFAGAASGGLAVPVLVGVGLGAGAVQVARSTHRANQLEDLALAGLADIDDAALAAFAAWMDRAMLAIDAVAAGAQGLRAAVARARFARGAIVPHAPGPVSRPTATADLIWEVRPPEVIDPVSGEFKQLAKHLPSDEIFEVRYNPSTQAGTMTRLRTGQQGVIIAGRGQPLPKGLLPSGTPADTTALARAGGRGGEQRAPFLPGADRPVLPRTPALPLLPAEAGRLPDALKEFSGLEGRIDALGRHPDSGALMRDLEYAEFWARRGRHEEARELLEKLSQKVARAEKTAQQEGLAHSFSETEETRLSRIVEYTPGPETPIALDATAPLPGDPTGELLLEHVRRAVARFEQEALTDPQVAALRALERGGRRHPLYDAYRGSRIDEFAKESVMQDPRLQHVYVTVSRERGADFLDSRTHHWYDMTTTHAWRAHQAQYGPGGFRLPTEIAPAIQASEGLYLPSGQERLDLRIPERVPSPQRTGTASGRDGQVN
jgi:hypothetical protein